MLDLRSVSCIYLKRGKVLTKKNHFRLIKFRKSCANTVISLVKTRCSMSKTLPMMMNVSLHGFFYMHNKNDIDVIINV